jgi:hypothetical protein
MGHPLVQTTILLSGVKSNSSISEGVCEICLRAKQTRENFPISSNKALESFALIHCDIWGPYRVASHCGAHYFLTIVDDFSRSVWVYLMAEKKEVADVIMEFCTMVTTQFEKSVKCMIEKDCELYYCCFVFIISLLHSELSSLYIQLTQLK